MRCTIYTDGSFRKTTKGGIYGCGIFALFEGVAEPVRMKWADNNSDWAAMWNIAGELCAVLGFMDFIDKEFPEYNEIDIYYDQNGVEIGLLENRKLIDRRHFCTETLCVRIWKRIK